MTQDTIYYNFIFTKALIILNGPFYERLSKLVDFLTLCNLMNYEYRVLWEPIDDDKNCTFLNLHDLIVNEDILKNVVQDVSILHGSDSYYYNPNVSINQTLVHTKTTEEKNDYDLHNVKQYEWLVISNTNDKNNIVNLPSCIDFTRYQTERKKTFNRLEPDYITMGSLNAITEEYEGDLIGLYITNKSVFLETTNNFYIEHIKSLANNTKVFLSFSEDIDDIEDKKHVISKLKTILPIKNMFHLNLDDVVDENANKLLTFRILTTACKLLVTDRESVDDYIHAVAYVNLVPFHVVDIHKQRTTLENCSYKIM